MNGSWVRQCYLFLSNVYYRIMFVFIVCYYMFTILDYSSALEYSIIRRYTNIVYYYYMNIANAFTKFDELEALLIGLIRVTPLVLYA